MSAPTLTVRNAVYDRDGRACVACRRTDGLSFQHRRAVGMGGSKIQPGATDGLTLCVPCNEACEHYMQTLALAYGWKVRKWADPGKVPVYSPHEWAWFLLDGMERTEITSEAAIDAMCGVYGDEYLQGWMEAML